MIPLRHKDLVTFLFLLGVSNASHSVVSPVVVSKPNIDLSIGVGTAAGPVLPRRALPANMRLRTSSRFPLDQYDQDLGSTTFRWNRATIKRPSFNGVEDLDRTEFAARHYLKVMSGVGVEHKKQAQTADLTSLHDMGRGPVVAKFGQALFGVEVFNRELNILMDQDHNMVAASGYFSSVPTDQLGSPKLRSFGSTDKAFSAALTDLADAPVSATVIDAKRRGRFDVATLSTNIDLELRGLSRAKRVYFPGESEVIPAHYLEVGVTHPTSGQEMLYSFVVDKDGKVLYRRNLVENEAYEYGVFGRQMDQSLLQGPHGDVIPKIDEEPDATDIVDMTEITVDALPILSTVDPWIPGFTSSLEGNNAFAYGDITGGDDKDETDISPDLTSDKGWNYVYDPVNGSAKENYSAAIVNLFYMNNYLHDWWYDHGFDEQSFNAQFLNYDRGGIGGDPLIVQGQDSSGFNNANMYTPADGASPRMQQYLFLSKDIEYGDDFGLTVTSHPEIGLMGFTAPAMFGPQVYPTLSARVVVPIDGLVGDGGTETDACEPITNVEEVAGNILLVDRPAATDCTYVTQAENARIAGAVALVIATDDYVLFGDVTPNVVPTIGVSSNDIAPVRALIDASEEVTAELLSNGALKDSTFDNGIIAHEWGHYIQNRLVGNANGLVNFQGRAMGEGWSDFHALMFLLRESHAQIEGNANFETGYTVSTHVANFTNSVRRAPYTVNMTVNPLTFTHIQDGAEPDGLPSTSNGSPHAAGEVWASMLWDIYVGLLDVHAFSEAESRMADYLVAGYKMTPIAPTYTEARDALLAAMFASDTADYTLAIEAFARRGMGLGAVPPSRGAYPLSGVSESYLSQLSTYETENFDLTEDFDGLDAGFCSRDGVLDVGETGTISFDVSNTGSEFLSMIRAQAVVTSGHDVTMENSGRVEFPNVDLFETVFSPEIEVVLNAAGTADTLTMELQFLEVETGDETVEPAPVELAAVVNYDFEPQPLLGDQVFEDMESRSFFSAFKERVLYQGFISAEGTQVADADNVALFQGATGEPLGTRVMLLLNNPYPTDVVTETIEFTVGDGADFAISFWHYYWIEADWDGGVVEMSIDGGDWQDAADAGGQFSIGYPSTLLDFDQSALSGRLAYTGRLDANSFEGARETISFGTRLNGSKVRFRFRIVSDQSVADYGWWIDNVSVSNIASPMLFETVPGDSVVCDNSLPRLSLDKYVDSVDEGASVGVLAETIDRNSGDVLTYSWVQLSGPEAVLVGADTREATITAPRVKDTQTLVFAFTVDDGAGGEVSQQFSLEVTNVPPELSLSASQDSLEEGAQTSVSVEVINAAEDDTYTYQWSQTSGSAATLSGQNTSDLTIGLPRIAAVSEDLSFSVSVSDGVDVTTEEYVVSVSNISPEVAVAVDLSSVQEGGIVSASVTVTNAAAGENYTYAWAQTSGSLATISGRNTASVTITTPKVSATETLRFEVIVSDGAVNVPFTLSITVQDKPSSGGSSEWYVLMLLALIAWRMRYVARPTH